jgi:hypothetical protein
LALLLIVIFLGGLVHAQATSAPISVVVTQNTVTVDLRLQMRENFTSLPIFRVTLDASNSSLIAGPMEKAMQKLVSPAHIVSLTLHAGTSLINSSQQTWLMSENYTIVVEGVNSDFGGTVRSNLAILKMDVSTPIALGGNEINSVGAKYLLGPLKSLTTTSTTTYFLDGATYLNSNVPGNTTAIFNILDFSWVSPVSQWNNQYDTFGSSSVWSFTPNLNPYNLTVGIRHIEDFYFPVYSAIYVPTLELTAPARAWADGTAVVFDLQTPADSVMALIIVTSVIVLAASMILDRRLRPKIARRKKR